MSEQEKLIEDFETQHPNFFNPDYRKLLVQESVESVRLKLSELDSWIGSGGVVKIRNFNEEVVDR